MLVNISSTPDSLFTIQSQQRFLHYIMNTTGATDFRGISAKSRGGIELVSRGKSLVEFGNTGRNCLCKVLIYLSLGKRQLRFVKMILKCL